MFQQATIDIYNLENYTFGAKDPQHEKDKSVADRLNRMKGTKVYSLLDVV
jgi:hypothetical protein